MRLSEENDNLRARKKGDLGIMEERNTAAIEFESESIWLAL